MTTTPLNHSWCSIVLMADSHIVEQGSRLDTVDTNAHARAIVRAIREDKAAPCLVVHLGDVADSSMNPERIATKEAYAAAREIFNELPLPFMAIPGNHDDASLLARELVHQWDSVTDGVFRRACGDVEIVGLGLVEATDQPWNGICKPETLRELERVLTQVSRAIVISHYPLVDVDSDWINRRLSTWNREDVLQVLLRHRDKIEHLFHGHVHVDLATCYRGISSRGVPSTAENFSLENQDGGEIERSGEPISYFLVGIPVGDSGSAQSRPGIVVRKRSIVFGGNQ